ncbi:shikimate dehydrogenase [Tenacibaculum sp. SZ-18]|uniref:shikimate dehydrogenase family protein n=1 Tax=Tenacibaculum sp. SZ-18 TaxID=754423 RepID=UPI000C2CF0C0|nr:shikimate dehydrogenase [Tenacibaculum sp. SZ-18]AUC14299.1 shikimate dehydrogenase [Tenacibaculum sp. SZ-18]
MGIEEKSNLFGLLGKNISYSFSRGYFGEKFKELDLKDHSYVNFDLQDINKLGKIIIKEKNSLRGFNVTIPYKEAVIPFLDKIDNKAAAIGAVNTVKVFKNGKLKGYNTDYLGFKNSLRPFLRKEHKKALILGTGGASKAVAFALSSLDIKPTFVSRNTSDNVITYQDLNEELIKDNLVIINCTPLGTHPNVDQTPDIPYNFIGESHILYDLIYNPSKTLFLQKGELKGAQIKNGLEMLEIQAEKAWEIWQKE